MFYMKLLFIFSSDHNPFALRGLSLEISAGTKVGIQGRTGSGKTSLLMALFRMAELTQGRIAIDNVDIADVHLKKLRYVEPTKYRF